MQIFILTQIVELEISILTKQFRQVIESAPDLYNNMKMLLKIHTKPSVLYKDFLARPLVNKINKNKNQEIV